MAVVVGLKRVLGQLLDHSFDVVPALLLLALCAGQARQLVVVF